MYTFPDKSINGCDLPMVHFRPRQISSKPIKRIYTSFGLIGALSLRVFRAVRSAPHSKSVVWAGQGG